MMKKHGKLLSLLFASIVFVVFIGTCFADEHCPLPLPGGYAPPLPPGWLEKDLTPPEHDLVAIAPSHLRVRCIYINKSYYKNDYFVPTAGPWYASKTRCHPFASCYFRKQ